MVDLSALVGILEQGGVVACPTETWLGLLADARNPAAIERVAELKGRPATMPIALLLPDADALEEVAKPLGEPARALCADHWPGPLTLVVPAKAELNPRLTRDGKVGVRVPGPSPALDLTRAFGHALTATSANLTGQPPLRCVDELPESLAAGVDGTVPGISPGGAPSTFIDTTTAPMTILREGAIEIDPTAL
jgi:L-threonylcarbamoyladenylate synthase